jgi:type II secretory pathway pseudopilin PulG
MIEFAFAMLVVVPLLLGTIGVGLQLIQSMQTTQLARDAGRMYARGLDFGQPGNLRILATLGRDLGLHTTDSLGQAVLILSTVKYIDNAICPTGCTNRLYWVFAQRIVVGNNNYRTSNLGSPLTTAPSTTAITLDAGGNVSLADQTGNSNDRALFSNIGNPFVVAGVGTAVNNLPSGTVLYVTEAASQGFTMPPFATGGIMYAYNIF